LPRFRFKVETIGKKTQDDPIRPAIDIHELAGKARKLGQITTYYRYSADFRECEVMAEIEEADTADFLKDELRKRGVEVRE